MRPGDAARMAGRRARRCHHEHGSGGPTGGLRRVCVAPGRPGGGAGRGGRGGDARADDGAGGLPGLLAPADLRAPSPSCRCCRAACGQRPRWGSHRGDRPLHEPGRARGDAAGSPPGGRGRGDGRPRSGREARIPRLRRASGLQRPAEPCGRRHRPGTVRPPRGSHRGHDRGVAPRGPPPPAPGCRTARRPPRGPGRRAGPRSSNPGARRIVRPPAGRPLELPARSARLRGRARLGWRRGRGDAHGPRPSGRPAVDDRARRRSVASDRDGGRRREVRGDVAPGGGAGVVSGAR